MQIKIQTKDLVRTSQFIITTCVWSMTGSYIFSLFVSPHPVGIPHFHPIILPLVSCPFQVVPNDRSQVPSGGYPSPRWAVPQSWLGVPQDRIPPPVRSGCGATGGTPLAVSHRRTVLFKITIPNMYLVPMVQYRNVSCIFIIHYCAVRKNQLKLLCKILKQNVLLDLPLVMKY